MEKWKVNLAVLWFGQFFVMAGTTMITPFLPLYLQEMGMHNTHQVAIWSGMIFAANFVTSFLFQPLWGSVADRYGRKIMLLRSGYGMAIVMATMGLTGQAWQLLLLRLLNGTISGFNPASVTLLSANTPREKVGFAMGILQTGGVAGGIFGPLIGGLLADVIGYRNIFFLTGALICVASLLATFLVTDQFDRSAALSKPKMSTLESVRELAKITQLPALFTVTFLFQFALLSPSQLLPLYVQKIHGTGEMLAFFAGVVSSANGISNMAISPLLGKLGDKFGSERVLNICLVGTALSFGLQAMAGTVLQLIIARFVLGMFMGGLLPSVYALIRRFTPEGMESRSYSLNTSTLALGNVLGPITGGLLSPWIGIQGVFLLSGSLLLINAVWVRTSLNKRRPAASAN
ncbi:MFS transporter [Gorillibacterium massiliense]|uniref:MFS transporter n=1 Tax=Gorillibacterium massiliense TaxID=1280390 RepID=UPI0004B14C2F|nr:MFS transporter [Gorillibacterium massiliense]